jgi:hypothetical protein
MLAGKSYEKGIDRIIHIHSNREGRSLAVAYKAEEHEHGDVEVGFIWRGSKMCTCTPWQRADDVDL